MDEAQYRQTLLAILRAHSAAAIKTLRAFDAALPEKARAIQIMVHPSQDPDGQFTVMIHLDGPDLYVLQKAIADCRTLFDVSLGKTTLGIAVPLFDPFDLPFPVNDVLVDTATVWVQEIWDAFGGTQAGLPAAVFGEEDYGTLGVVDLKA